MESAANQPQNPAGLAFGIAERRAGVAVVLQPRGFADGLILAAAGRAAPGRAAEPTPAPRHGAWQIRRSGSGSILQRGHITCARTAAESPAAPAPLC